MKESSIELVNRTLAKRYAAEKRFRILGIGSVLLGLVALAFMLWTICSDGMGAFRQTFIGLDLKLDQAQLEINNPENEKEWRAANYSAVIKAALRERFPDMKSRSEKKRIYRLVSSGADYQLSQYLQENRELLNQTVRLWLPADDDIDTFVKGHIDASLPEADRRVKDNQIALVDNLKAAGDLQLKFSKTFFTAGDSREPEQAGIRGAIVGSCLTLLVTMALSFPLAVGAAVYLEEFAPKNRLTDIIEVNINNLAAVPSIVFGLLGLAVFLNLFGMPRSIPIVGGIVLALMTLPTIIISSRAALQAVPPSIREAALGLGASRMQTIFDHVLPLAMPGMLTGAIIGMAQALGETAPLLMIGMVAFVVDIPSGFTDPSTVLPVQIFLWSDSPERGFVEKTSGAIMVLLAFLVTMNALAVMLRRKFERRW